MHELDKRKSILSFVVLAEEVHELFNFRESYGFQAINMVGGMLAWEGKVE